jgi:hypothetical protein
MCMYECIFMYIQVCFSLSLSLSLTHTLPLSVYISAYLPSYIHTYIHINTHQPTHICTQQLLQERIASIHARVAERGEGGAGANLQHGSSASARRLLQEYVAPQIAPATNCVARTALHELRCTAYIHIYIYMQDGSSASAWRSAEVFPLPSSRLSRTRFMN